MHATARGQGLLDNHNQNCVHGHYFITLTCIPVTCPRGPRLLIACNAQMSWYTRVE